MLTIANVEQAKAWDGNEGDHWVLHADRYDRSGATTWRRFLATKPVQPGDRVLDIGCGTGQSTRDAARLAGEAGRAHGVDLSAAMLAEARRRTEAEGLSNVTYEQADAQVHAFDPAEYDVVISKMGAMFFSDFGAAFGNIRAALRDEGRLAVLTWRRLGDNEWLREIRGALAQGRDLGEPPVGAPSPLGLADRDFVTTMLSGAGFEDVAFEAIDEPLTFGIDADDAYSFMRDQGVVIGLTETLDAVGREKALADLYAVLQKYDGAEGVQLPSACWLITATARPTRP
jgi:SAM-dependent methyltransferase